MTLNQMIDNLLLIARNSNIGESEHLSRIQIEKWIIGYRALLIKQDLDRDRYIDDLYKTTIGPIHLDKKEIAPGKIVYEGDKELPRLINFNKRSGVICVRDMHGNIIQIGDYTKAKYQKYRKATCGDYIAWEDNSKIYVEGDSNQLEYIMVDVIAADPTEGVECFDPDAEFPVPESRIPLITQMILDRELRVMTQMPSDETNNSQDDNQNVYRRR